MPVAYGNRPASLVPGTPNGSIPGHPCGQERNGSIMRPLLGRSTFVTYSFATVTLVLTELAMKQFS
jgi:hypothetical protein